MAAIIVSVCFYKTSFQKRIFLPVFVWALWSAIETLTFNSITAIFGITASEAISIPVYVVLGILVSKSIQFMIVYVLYVNGLFKEFELGKIYWIIFLVLFFSSTCVSYLIFWMMNQINDPRFNMTAMFCDIGLYVSTFLSFFLYARSQRQNLIIRFQEQSEQQMRSQIKHMDEIILKQNELRAMRHDMNGHLIVLKEFFDNGDLLSGQRYISKLVNQLQSVTPAISTGNNALDAIINAKKSLAENKKIVFQTNIKVQEKLFIADEDFSIIFGNALDNAIEACDRLQDNEEKWINLLLQQNSKILFCRIANTAPVKKETNLVTNKQDKINHGFGVKNMQEALNKYRATVTFKQNEGQFNFNFVIFKKS